MHFDTIALIAIIALSACFFAWLIWARYAPLRLALDEPSGAFGDEASHHKGLGKVGNLVTALMLAKDGWQRLPIAAGNGLDGVFVRKSGRQFDVRIIETTCAREGDPKQSYDAGRLTDEHVITQLEQLKDAPVTGEAYLDAHSIDSIIKAIRRGSAHVSKQLYAHALDKGHTLIYSVRPDGALIDRPARVQRVSGSPHRLMLQALANGLARMDDGHSVAVSGAAGE